MIERPEPNAPSANASSTWLAGRRLPNARHGNTSGSNASRGAGQAELGPRDLAALVVLGSVNEGFGAFTEIVSAARSIAGPEWQPTGDVLAGAIERALDHGHLWCAERAESAEDVRLEISATGKGRLRELLHQPAPCCRRPIGRVAIALKVCFLGALDFQSGRQILEELSNAHRCELRHLREGCESCPATRAYARLWMDREIERIEQELTWLDRIRADLGAGATVG